MIKRLKKIFQKPTYFTSDKIFLDFDKQKILRTSNLDTIPYLKNRKGGKISYAEWAHVIGLFQSLFYVTLNSLKGNKILDVGCGAGLLSMASEPFISDGGKYLGMDVLKPNIDFCNTNYKHPNMFFEHFDINNMKYASNQKDELIPWDLKNDSFDLVTALSVWTHLNEAHAIYYLKEVERVLKKGGKAIISFFYLDDKYFETLENRKDEKGKFHKTNQLRWVFEEKAYNSEHWFCPKWVKVPEDAIAIDKLGMDRLIENSSLKIDKYYSGNWKELPGFYFQDVIVFEKE